MSRPASPAQPRVDCQGVDHVLLHTHLSPMCRESQVQELQAQLAEATAQPSHGTKAQLQHSLMAAQVPRLWQHVAALRLCRSISLGWV